MAEVTTASSPTQWRQPIHYKELPTESIPQLTAVYAHVLTYIIPHSMYINTLSFRLWQLDTCTYMQGHTISPREGVNCCGYAECQMEELNVT